MFVKVFPSLWQGTLCGRADDQLVFIFMLAHADQDGRVEIVQSIIAHQTGLSPDRVQASIDKLMAVDPESRTPDNEGRRLLRLDERSWGWEIPNYKKYRGIRDENDRREQNNRAQRKHRSAAVSHDQPKSSYTEGEAEGEAETEKPKDLATPVAETVGSSLNGNEVDTESEKDWAGMFEWFWSVFPKKVGKPAAIKAWRAIKPQNQATVDAMGDGLARWGSVWASKDRNFIPHPATWLNQRRWEDNP